MHRAQGGSHGKLARYLDEDAAWHLAQQQALTQALSRAPITQSDTVCGFTIHLLHLLQTPTKGRSKMGSYFPLDTTLCHKPDGRTPTWAYCIVVQGATTASTAKNLYADMHGRTQVARDEYTAQQSTFKSGAASDVAERRFTDGWAYFLKNKHSVSL